MGESFLPQAQIKLRSSRTKTEILEKLLWLFEVGHVCHTQYEERRKLKDTNEDQRCERAGAVVINCNDSNRNGYDDDNWRKRRLTSWIWLSEVPAAAPAPADGNDGGGGAAGGGDGCCCFYSTELCRNGLFR
ncbi:hypothetical protein RP20_CCG002309 [Aedes albopictus]|nr:hypothetical protein RP20_CCG002309 [Aedes albopictus]